MGSIYKTINIINNKIYVGKDTKNKPSYFGSGKVLKLAIKKYGKNNFKKEILEVCDNSILSEREIYWIQALNSNTCGIGYNLTEGGTGGDTFTHNAHKEETNRKRSLSLKGKISGDKNPSKRLEVRQKISETLKRKYASGEILPSMSGRKGELNPHTGSKRTDEQKDRMRTAQHKRAINKSNSMKIIWKNRSESIKMEIAKKISEAGKGRKMTEEQKIKNINSQKRRFENPENRKKASEAQKIRFQNETGQQKQDRIQKLKLFYAHKKSETS